MNQEVIELTKDYRNTIFAVSLTKGKQPIELDQWGAGEYKVTYPIKEMYGNNIVIYIPFLTFTTLEKALIFTRFCEKQKVNIQQTVIGYLSYGRQERETEREPKLLDLLFKSIYQELQTPVIIEPHNFNSVKCCCSGVYWTIPHFQKEDIHLPIIAPDKGAKDRFHKLGLKTDIEIRKTRTSLGVVSEIEYDFLQEIETDPETFDLTMIIYDDICDGGRTFVNVAELVKERYPKVKIELHVAHAILPFGVESLKGKIDKIVALDTCFPVGVYFDGFLEIRSAIDMFF